MILDCHTHIFSPAVCSGRERYLADPQFECIYRNPRARLIDHRQLLAAMDESSVDCCVAMGYPWERSDLCAEQNEYLSSVRIESGGKIAPFGSVPLNDAVDIDRRVRDIKAGGLFGVGEISFYRDGMSAHNVRYLDEILRSAVRYDLAVCIHVNEPVGHRYTGKYDPELDRLCAVIAEHPEAKIILSHWGGGLVFYELMPEMSRILRNCRYDSAASPYIYRDDIYAAALRCIGGEKILFGSDYPLLSFKKYIDALRREIPDDAIRARILGQNAADFLNIK